MRVKLIDNHRYQTITFHGIEVGKTAPVEIQAEYTDDAVRDARLELVYEPVEDAPKKKGKGR